MKTLSYKEFFPTFNDSNFLAEGAKLIGRGNLERNVNIWFNAVIRGDVNQISIGENTNIQDLSVLHVTNQFELIIGKNVTVGHSAILHGCVIGDGSLIGMGAKILDGAKIGKNTLVAAGSVVAPGKVFREGVMLMGSPAKLKRERSTEESHAISNHYKSYVELANTYQTDLK